MNTEVKTDAEINAIYEKEIHPLLNEALNLCKKYSIPMLAAAAVNKAEDLSVIHQYTCLSKGGSTPHQFLIASEMIKTRIDDGSSLADILAISEKTGEIPELQIGIISEEDMSLIESKNQTKH